MTDIASGTDIISAASTTIDNSPTLGNTTQVAGAPAATSKSVGFALTGNQAYVIDAIVLDAYPFTITALCSGVAAPTVNRLIFNGQNMTTGVLLEVSVYGAAGPPALAGRLRVSLYDGANTKHLFSSAVIDDGEIHHIGWTAASGADWVVYVDGVDVTTIGAGFEASSAVTFPAIGSQWAIGNYPEAGYGDKGFGGDISQVVVWDDQALPPERIAAHADAALTGWEGDTGDQRINHVLDAIGYTGDRNLDTSVTEMSVDGYGSSALDYMLLVADTENSPLYIDGTGAIRFVSRANYITATRHATSNATFGDGNGGIGYTDLIASFNNTNIRNRVQVSRAGASAAIIQRDEDSIAAYGLRTYTRSTLSAADIQSKNIALWVLAHYKDPLLRFDRVTLEPRDAASWAQIVRMIGDRVTIIRRPQGVGTAIDKEVLIESISCRMDAESLQLTWDLSLADLVTYWVLGVSTLGETTTLSY